MGRQISSVPACAGTPPPAKAATWLSDAVAEMGRVRAETQQELLRLQREAGAVERQVVQGILGGKQQAILGKTPGDCLSRRCNIPLCPRC